MQKHVAATKKGESDPLACGDGIDRLKSDVPYGNIGDLQQTETAQHFQKMLLHEVGRIAKVGGWAFEVETGQGFWTDVVAQIHDVESTQPISFQMGMQFIAEEHRSTIKNAIKNAIENAVSYDLEIEIVSAKGIRKWVRTIGHPVVENGRVVRVIGSMQDISERKKSDAALRESEQRLRTLFEGAPEAIFVQCNGVFAYVNGAMLRLLGAKRPEELLGMETLSRVSPEFHNFVNACKQYQSETGLSSPLIEVEFIRLDNTRVPVETTAMPYRLHDTNGYIIFVRDITARRKAEAERAALESQLRQSQKMESIGRLAGGVAHDFNNFLMSIMGNAELCRDELGPTHPAQVFLDEIVNAAQRSAGITRKLLAFARKQPIAPEVMDLNRHVADMLKFLRSLITENISLTWSPEAREAHVEMDPSQIDQILSNLIVNAKDAISGAGAITVKTENLQLSEARHLRHAEIAPGDYVVLTVTDTGIGMSEETLSHLFEPFFSTKEKGKGTGLGLSTVYGIVKQNCGHIGVESEVNHGSAFHVYFRQHAAHPAPIPQPNCGTETVLLVEDDDSVRAATVRILHAFGYRVLAAAGPQDALRTVQSCADPIDLLITDAIMPGMSGRELAAQISVHCAGVKCLFISGYANDIIAAHGVLASGVHFLTKPFSKDALARKVRQALGAS
jgi:PAS domain S-box-containing protein